MPKRCINTWYSLTSGWSRVVWRWQQWTDAGPYSERVTGLNPQKSLHKNFWVYFLAEWPWQLILIHTILAGFSVEMILILRTVIFRIFITPQSADVMNIIVAIIFGLKRAPECIQMHHFEGEHATAPPQTPPPSRPHFWKRAWTDVVMECAHSPHHSVALEAIWKWMDTISGAKRWKKFFSVPLHFFAVPLHVRGHWRKVQGHSNNNWDRAEMADRPRPKRSLTFQGHAVSKLISPTDSAWFVS